MGQFEGIIMLLILKSTGTHFVYLFLGLNCSWTQKLEEIAECIRNESFAIFRTLLTCYL